MVTLPGSPRPAHGEAAATVKAIAGRYAGKPLIVLGVADGATTMNVGTAAQKLGVPVLADPASTIAPRWGVAFGRLVGFTAGFWPPAAFAVVGPNGRIVAMSASTEAIDKALEQASWKYAGQEFPASVSAAIALLEFGQQELALPVLVKAAKGGEADREAAEKFLAPIRAAAAKALAGAKDLAENGMHGDAYFAFLEVASTYKGLDDATAAAKSAKELEKHKEVKTEKKAMKICESAAKMAQSTNKAEQETGIQYLEAVVRSFPGTRAATLADGLLRSLKPESEGTVRGPGGGILK